MTKGKFKKQINRIYDRMKKFYFVKVKYIYIYIYIDVCFEVIDGQ